MIPNHAVIQSAASVAWVMTQRNPHITCNIKGPPEEDFSRHFSPAAFMGKGGEVTPIDFRRSFVIAKVLPVTDRDTELTPMKLAKTGHAELELTYRLKTGERRAYSTQPLFLLLVCKRY